MEVWKCQEEDVGGIKVSGMLSSGGYSDPLVADAESDLGGTPNLWGVDINLGVSQGGHANLKNPSDGNSSVN